MSSIGRAVCPFFNERGQMESVGRFSVDRHTQHAATVPQHEGNLLGRDRLGSTNEVAFVLAIVSVQDDDHSSLFEGCNPVVDRAEVA